MTPMTDAERIALLEAQLEDMTIRMETYKASCLAADQWRPLSDETVQPTGGQEYEVVVRGRWEDNSAMPDGFAVVVRETPAHVIHLRPENVIRYRPARAKRSEYIAPEIAMPRAEVEGLKHSIAEAWAEVGDVAESEQWLREANAKLTTEVARLKAELAQYDLGEWDDDRLKEWLPGDAEQELIARLTSRSENWEDEARTAKAQLAALREEWDVLEAIVNGNGWVKWATQPVHGQRVRAWAIVSGEYDADEEVLLLDSTGELALAWWQPAADATDPAQ